jgi:hypothetical protein
MPPPRLCCRHIFLGRRQPPCCHYHRPLLSTPPPPPQCCCARSHHHADAAAIMAATAVGGGESPLPPHVGRWAGVPARSDHNTTTTGEGAMGSCRTERASPCSSPDAKPPPTCRKTGRPRGPHSSPAEELCRGRRMNAAPGRRVANATSTSLLSSHLLREEAAC